MPWKPPLHRAYLQSQAELRGRRPKRWTPDHASCAALCASGFGRVASSRAHGLGGWAHHLVHLVLPPLPLLHEAMRSIFNVSSN
eukprot:1185913-Prorocentrum_minimum.AAC.4